VRAWLIGALVLLVAAPAEAAPRIELYTMGPGDDVFSAFGHAAICTLDEGQPRGRCYNYGTADFSTPVPLTWDFIRGRARFWVSVTDRPTLLYTYARWDRTVYRQVLPLSPEQAAALARALEDSTGEAVKYYRYHHFDDNCTTRIRDLIDRATSGRLSREAGDRGVSFRQWARRGFAGNWPLLVVTDLLLGRRADQSTDAWQAMFLPDELRDEVSRRFGAPAEVVGTRRRPPRQGSIWLGALAFAAFGLGLAGLIALGARLGRRAERVAVGIAGVALGLVGVAVWGLALLSSFVELRWNEVLLIFWPSDLLLGFLSVERRRPYLAARLALLGLVVLLHLGLLVQPLTPLGLALPPLVAAYLAARRPR
jgi:hypothetical protein